MGRLPVRIKLFLPYFLVVLVAVSILTILSIRMANREIRLTIENNLQLETQTITRMFEREYCLKLERVKSNLRVFNDLFYACSLRTTGPLHARIVTNQITGEAQEASLPEWYLDGESLYGNVTLVDRLETLLGGTFTIFQRSDSGFVRISTNVINNDGDRATGSFIPLASPVSESICKGKSFTGRAWVVNDWYITAYEPIVRDGAIIGMLYAGDKEKDLNQLRAILNGLTIGKSGYVFAFDEQGILLMHPEKQGEPVEEPLVQRLRDQKQGIISLGVPDQENIQTIAFQYFPEFKLMVCAAIDMSEESKILTAGILRNAILIAVVSILLFSLFLFFLTRKSLHRFLEQLEQSDKKLASAREALQKSANQFRTFFNNSSDDIFVEDFSGRIVEVNEVACKSLGYTRDELVGKHFRELKTDKYQKDVARNLEMIRHFGQHRYETENLTKEGKVIPVEMKSRVIEYDGQKRILTIARDITERKEIEERILKAIISTEESERKRFAADLHDDLGPILSTIKLYSGLLKNKEQKATNRIDTVANIDELVDMAIRTSREISNRIRPNVLQDFGLGAAISEFCSFINESGSMVIEVRTDEYGIAKRSIEESILYQVAKELINNTIKHAHASQVLIELKSIKNQIILYYRDNGIGFDSSQALQNKSGIGLYNIVNKVKTINGTCDLNTTPGKGMVMTISVKLKEE